MIQAPGDFIGLAVELGLIDDLTYLALAEIVKSMDLLDDAFGSIEALSESLGMTMIAEGVEAFEDVAYLQAATRIRYAQGFYFAKPILLEEQTLARRVVGAARSGASGRDRPALRG